MNNVREIWYSTAQEVGAINMDSLSNNSRPDETVHDKLTELCL